MTQIWIVDDDEEMIHAVQLMLRMMHHDSLFFIGARQAGKSLLDGNKPDVFILDINMPEVSGVEFLEFLRSRKEYKDIPVVMLSTEAGDMMVDTAIALGADAYVTKPVAFEELEAAIKKAIMAHGA